MTDLAESVTTPDERQRILESAYELFSRRGLGAVGVQDVLEHAEVEPEALERHFAHKDELVLAFLELREERWTREWVEAEARKRGSTPEEHLLAIFDLFDEWFQKDDFEGCAFINVLLETREHPLGRASAVYLANIRSILTSFAAEAGFREPEAFAHSWHILMKGSIVAAHEGDRDAAKRAKAMAAALIEQYRP